MTYANPAALALTGTRARCPPRPLPGRRPPAWSCPGAAAARRSPVVDPVAVVGAGGTVPGMRLEIADDDDRLHAYWVTGSQLLSATGVAGGPAIVAFFPVPSRTADGTAGLAPARWARMGSAGPPAGALAGADGAAIMRADPTARTAVAQEALREGLPPDERRHGRRRRRAGARGAGVAGGARQRVDELTARALIASRSRSRSPTRAAPTTRWSG